MIRKTRVEKLIDIADDALEIMYHMDFDYEIRSILLNLKCDLERLRRKVFG